MEHYIKVCFQSWNFQIEIKPIIVGQVIHDVLSTKDMGREGRRNVTWKFCVNGMGVYTEEGLWVLWRRERGEVNQKGVGDIFIWHATRLHPSFINWRSRNEHSRQHPTRHTPSLTLAFLVSRIPPASASFCLSISLYLTLTVYICALAETANEDSPFLTFEHSSSSRSRPHINPLLLENTFRIERTHMCKSHQPNRQAFETSRNLF